MVMRGVALALAAVLASTAAQAQTIYNPRAVEFEYDAPEFQTVTSFALEFWIQGTVTNPGCVAVPPAQAVATYSAPQIAATATGTANTYAIPIGAFVPLIGTPIGFTYVGCLKARRDTEESARSDASNPFGWRAALLNPRKVSFR